MITISMDIDIDKIPIINACMNIMDIVTSMNNEELSKFKKTFQEMCDHWNGDIECLPENFPFDFNKIVRNTKIRIEEGISDKLKGMGY